MRFGLLLAATAASLLLGGLAGCSSSYDDGSLTAVAGMTLPLDEAAGAPEPPPAAEPFEPAPIETAVGNGAGGHGGAGGAGVGAMSSSLHVLHDVEMVVMLGEIAGAAIDELGVARAMPPTPAQLVERLSTLAVRDPARYADLARFVATVS